MGNDYVNIHQDLVDACLAGDESAYSELYKLYSKAMFNVALRIARDSDDAEDILQDAFVSAFTNLYSFSGKATFGAWLKRIVINKAINHLKKQKANLVELSVDYELEDKVENEPDMEFKVKTVQKAIQELPDGYRVVLSLYLLEGYDHKEIAQIMGISESTSKTQYLRAKQKIVDLIGKERTYER
jgi:RNA polymerase sigma-70 factor (ECF subfamily)